MGEANPKNSEVNPYDNSTFLFWFYGVNKNPYDHFYKWIYD